MSATINAITAQPGDDYPTTPASDPGQVYTPPSEDPRSVPNPDTDPTPRDIYQYSSNKPVHNDPIVWTGRKTIYYWPNDEGMYACIDRHLESIDWVQIVSWNNNTDASQSYQVAYTTSLTITTGSEINAGFSLGGSYSGMSVGLDFSTKTFKETETTSSKTTTITVNVPPKSMLVFYQKRYTFRDETTFINDAWANEWNAGSWGDYDLALKTSRVQIMADEYFTNDALLPVGPGTFDCDSFMRGQKGKGTRKRENLTSACKKKLDAMGL